MKGFNEKVITIVKHNISDDFKIIPIGHHELGRHLVYCIIDSKNNEYILKIYGKAGRWCNEITAIKKLDDVVVLPQIVNYGKLQDGTEWILSRKIPGFVLNEVWSKLRLEERERIVKEMGEYLGRIHKKSTYSYYGPWIECASNDYRFQDYIKFRKYNDEKIFKQILTQNLPHEKLLRVAYRVLISYYEKINDKTLPRICHRDFLGRNIIVNKFNDKWSVQGIIDFEHCQPDDPYIDLSSMYQSVFIDYPTLESSFLNGYTKYMYLSKNFGDKLKYYLINTGLHICSWTYQCAPSYYKRGIRLLKLILKD
ncbi:aminoglycoside phosphotransferase family protein [Caldisalinibacter kiritimatiensis]|uniref:Aminoglycoside phosphotransferase domain-containing protein n=1 Tax=Caldisalinibacter kiritimatiensis TaxID=1304284 RepID=R1AXG9_9FIRM|nr:aminoglycoside phosphotransferase family protein [Caldisalinibacter kiritimatiensis]EOD01352.1 hypothetical protein L21TH_0573 [Caldisalinibacter kiritimatiensis]